MRDTPPAVALADKLLTLAKLLSGEDIVDAEPHHHAPRPVHIDRTRDHRLRVDRAPVGKLHRAFKAGDPADMGLGGDFAEKAGAGQISGDHAGDVAGKLLRRRRVGHEIGHRHRHRFDHAFGDLEPERTALLGRCGSSPERQGGEQGQE